MTKTPVVGRLPKILDNLTKYKNAEKYSLNDTGESLKLPNPRFVEKMIVP